MVQSKATTTNPKDLVGVKKISLTSIPSTALLHEARAFMNGAQRYGPFNWRDVPVQARIYVDACLRHLFSWFEGEEYADDSGVHHLGHARACLGILLDAIENHKLVDDRPIKNGSTHNFVEALAAANKTLSPSIDKEVIYHFEQKRDRL